MSGASGSARFAVGGDCSHDFLTAKDAKGAKNAKEIQNRFASSLRPLRPWRSLR
jgi:hypothetical protein